MIERKVSLRPGAASGNINWTQLGRLDAKDRKLLGYEVEPVSPKAETDRFLSGDTCVHAGSVRGQGAVRCDHSRRGCHLACSDRNWKPAPKCSSPTRRCPPAWTPG